MSILVLPPQIRDQIAAGEVVERPASVVKELVENAVDAGAKNIEIFLEDGGKTKIEVRDDGHGMTPQDAEKSVLRHATSKIKKISDLFSIQSFGFRGEALAAISSISDFELTTKPAGQNLGTRLRVRSGKAEKIEQTAANTGTRILVRDLFCTTPVRREYLKSDAREYWASIKEIFGLALSHREIGFQVFNSEKLVFDLPPSGDGLARASKILKINASDLLPITSANRGQRPDRGVKVSGFLCRPDSCARTKSGQFLLVNGRRIDDFRLHFAVREAYLSACGMEKGWHPRFAIFLEIDPVLVDVNVHPRKLEVKFLDPSRVFSEIEQTVFSVLSEAAKTFRATPDPVAMTNLGPFLPPQKNFRAPSSDFKSTPSFPRAPKENFWEKNFSASNFEREKKFETPLQQPKTSSQKIDENAEIGELKLIGQGARKYIFAENEQGVFIFDQHAAHERVRFEKFWKKYFGAKLEIQTLLTPQKAKLPESEISALHEHKAQLEKMGFDLKFPADDLCEISAVPTFLAGENLENLVADLAAYFQNEMVGESAPEKVLRKLVEYKACRGAVFFGDELARDEMEQILIDLQCTQFRWLCAHGRPNYWFISFDEMDGWFHR